MSQGIRVCQRVKERWVVSNLSVSSTLSSREQEALHEHSMSVIVEIQGNQQGGAAGAHLGFSLSNFTFICFINKVFKSFCPEKVFYG